MLFVVLGGANLLHLGHDHCCAPEPVEEPCHLCVVIISTVITLAATICVSRFGRAANHFPRVTSELPPLGRRLVPVSGPRAPPRG